MNVVQSTVLYLKGSLASGLLLLLLLLVMVAKNMKKTRTKKSMTLSLLADAADLVSSQPVFTTAEVAFRFPCTIHAGDMVIVTLHVEVGSGALSRGCSQEPGVGFLSFK